MDFSGVPNSQEYLGEETCKAIIKGLKDADFHGMKLLGETLESTIRTFHVEAFYDVLNTYVALEILMSNKMLLTDKDRHILANFASMDPRIKRLYEEMIQQEPLIAIGNGILVVRG